MYSLFPQFIEPYPQSAFIPQPFPHKLPAVEDGGQRWRIRDKRWDSSKRLWPCAVREPAVVFHIDMAVPALQVLPRQHIPSGHMPHLVLIGDLSVHPTGFDDPLKNRPCHCAFERDHPNDAKFPRQRNGSCWVCFHQDF